MKVAGGLLDALKQQISIVCSFLSESTYQESSSKQNNALGISKTENTNYMATLQLLID